MSFVLLRAAFVLSQFLAASAFTPQRFFPAQWESTLFLGDPPLGCGEFAANRTFFVIAYRAPAHPSSHMTSSLNDLGDWVAWPRPCTGQLRLPVRCAALRGGRRPHEDYENRSTATIQNKLRRARILYILHALYVRTFAFQILGVLELRFSDFYFKFVSCLLRYW